MNSIKHEFGFIKSLIKREKALKTLRRGWNKDYFKRTIGVYFIAEIILTFTLILPIYYLFESYFETFDMGIETKSEILIFGVLLGPFIEELIFRWPLVYSEKHFKLFFYGIALISIGIYWPIGLVLLIFSIFASVNSWDNLKTIKPKKIHAKYAKSIFWFSVIAFGLFHIFNFDFKSIPIYLYPIMVVSQLIGGLSLGIVRIRFGLRYAIINHILWNFMVFSGEIFFE